MCVCVCLRIADANMTSLPAFLVHSSIDMPLFFLLHYHEITWRNCDLINLVAPNLFIKLSLMSGYHQIRIDRPHE